MSRLFSASIVLASLLLAATPARAEKFGFCEDEVKSATQCFLVMTQETYRKCRIVQTMMIIEYGFPESYLPDNNGEKLNFCIDKHRRGIQLPYQAALKEFSRRKEAQEALRALHQAWLARIEGLAPAIVETKEAYETRVNEGSDELLAKIEPVRAAVTAADAAGQKPARSTATGKRKRK